MYGEKRELITFQCVMCKVPTPMWVDCEDLERAKLGLPVQFAFASRAGLHLKIELTRLSDSCQCS
jgi:hypothetical protein